MLATGLIGATRPGIGWDEAATADVATRSPAEIWAMIQNVDAVIGPYYVVMHFWTSVFGLSELSLRLPSVLAMAAAVGLTAELGRRLIDPAAGLMAGLLLCALPAVSRYAQEARPYALCCLFAALATLLLHRNLDPGRGVAAWAGYAMAVVLIGLTHLVAVSVLGAHALIVLRRRNRRELVFWAAAAGAALLCLVPLILLGAGQRDEQIGWVTPPTTTQLIEAPGAVAGAAGTGFLLLGLALVATRRWRGLAALALVPVIVAATLSHLGEPVWVVPRYLLIALFPFALLAAAAATYRTGLLRPALVLLVVAVTAVSAQRDVRGVAGHAGGNYKQAAAVIRALDRPGDTIVFQSGRTMRTGISYHLRDEPDRPADVLVDRPAAEREMLSAGEFGDPAPHLVNRERVWLVVMGKQADPIAGREQVGPVLRENFVRTRMWQFSRTTLALYTHR